MFRIEPASKSRSKASAKNILRPNEMIHTLAAEIILLNILNLCNWLLTIKILSRAISLRKWFQEFSCD